MLSHSVMSDSATPWTADRQAPLSMAFSRQEYWSGLPGPPPGDLHNPGIPGIEPMSHKSPSLAGGFFTTWEALSGVAAAAAKSLQSCPTLRDPMDCSPAGSSVHGIFQARILEWGAIAFSGYIHYQV